MIQSKELKQLHDIFFIYRHPHYSSTISCFVQCLFQRGAYPIFRRIKRINMWVSKLENWHILTHIKRFKKCVNWHILTLNFFKSGNWHIMNAKIKENTKHDKNNENYIYFFIIHKKREIKIVNVNNSDKTIWKKSIIFKIKNPFIWWKFPYVRFYPICLFWHIVTHFWHILG